MKKLIIVLLLVLLLCSCGVSEPVIEKPVPENSISGTDEQIPIGSATPMVEYSITDRIRMHAEEELIRYTENSHLLEKLGISQKVSNIVANENGTFTFDLTLSRDGNEITKNLRGFWLESYGCSPNLNWGGYSLTNNGYLALCGINQLFLINLDDFSLLDIEFELDSWKDPYYDQWINGVAYDEKNGWVVSVTNGKPSMLYDEKNTWTIYIFDENGKELRTHFPIAEAPAGGWADYSTPSVLWKCDVIRKNKKAYYSFGGYSYCAHTGEVFSGFSISDPYDAKADDYSVYFYHCHNIDRTTEENPSGIDLGYYAVLKDSNENILAFFPTDENYISEAYDYETGEVTLKLTHHGGLHFTLENSYLGKSMELDFEKEEYILSYSYTDEHLREHIVDSADGNYSLWQAGVQSGGEAYFYEVAFKNNKTGKIYHIESNGTNVGGFSSAGFLRNGDFYVFNSKNLRIYDPETVKTIFDLDKNFPTGNRILYTFRRDPNDFSYIVVYSDSTNKQIDEGWASDDWTMPFCFKVAYLDRDGNLIKSFESKIPVLADFFGIEGLDMRYSEDTLTFITHGGKGLSQREFTFDRKTETFSEPTEVK